MEFNRQLFERVKALPGATSATLADFSPLSFTIHSDGVMPQGYVPHVHESVEADRGNVGPDICAQWARLCSMAATLPRRTMQTHSESPS